jgi:hypothetical protein
MSQEAKHVVRVTEEERQTLQQLVAGRGWRGIKRYGPGWG